MKIENKEDFLNKSITTLEAIVNDINNAKPLIAKDLKKDKTALVIIDMINGFTKEGTLMSQRIANIIPEVVETTKICKNEEFKLLAFADCHCDTSIEFKAYPTHCIKGTSESELIDELKNIGDMELIEKNSTNGFIEDDFKRWLENNKEIENFIVIGDCTDICIMQFVLSLKTYFNKNDKEVNIIIPLDSVETFDLDSHNGDLMNVFSIFTMQSNGAEIVSKII